MFKSGNTSCEEISASYFFLLFLVTEGRGNPKGYILSEKIAEPTKEKTGGVKTS